MTAFASPEATVPSGLVGITPTAVVDSLLTMPGMDVWFDVPNLGVKPTF